MDALNLALAGVEAVDNRKRTALAEPERSQAIAIPAHERRAVVVRAVREADQRESERRRHRQRAKADGVADGVNLCTALPEPERSQAAAIDLTAQQRPGEVARGVREAGLHTPGESK